MDVPGLNILVLNVYKSTPPVSGCSNDVPVRGACAGLGRTDKINSKFFSLATSYVRTAASKQHGS